jgi:large subunit ribosomal protein L25
MNQFELTAQPRPEQGRGASRRLRRVGSVPAILYGAGKEPTPITLNHDDLRHRLANEAFYSHILSLSLNGAEERVVLKDVQRHPFKAQIIHIDLQRIDESQELTMRVPVHFINEDSCIGVKQSGGLITRLMSDLEVICLPRHLPEYLEVDVANLDLNQTIHIGDLAMPEGVRLALLAHGGDPSLPVVAVHVPKMVIEEEEAAAAEAAALAAAAGEPGAEGEATPAPAADTDAGAAARSGATTAGKPGATTAGKPGATTAGKSGAAPKAGAGPKGKAKDD